jgi:NitT/TauT family transport system substrate-binding protein
LEFFAEGKIDAFLGFPPESQELRARHAGHVILNITTDRPWSQYFCCMMIGNRDYIRKYPIATKRVLRAVLKATDFCASKPTRDAQRLVDGGFTSRYDYAFETLNGIPYESWRDYDAEDTIRFYALRLRDAGMIKSTPQKIIADGTDWRFFDELKRARGAIRLQRHLPEDRSWPCFRPQNCGAVSRCSARPSRVLNNCQITGLLAE